MYGNTYIKEAINNVEIKLSEFGRQLFKTARSPIKPGYWPEIDVSPVLEYDQKNYYQTKVGQLRWDVDLGQIDINLKTALLFHYIAQPMHGNIDQVLHTF